jgi:hypothetical protein
MSEIDTSDKAVEHLAALLDTNTLLAGHKQAANMLRILVAERDSALACSKESADIMYRQRERFEAQIEQLQKATAQIRDLPKEGPKNMIEATLWVAAAITANRELAALTQKETK